MVNYQHENVFVVDIAVLNVKTLNIYIDLLIRLKNMNLLFIKPDNCQLLNITY